MNCSHTITCSNVYMVCSVFEMKCRDDVTMVMLSDQSVICSGLRRLFSLATACLEPQLLWY